MRALALRHPEGATVSVMVISTWIADKGKPLATPVP
jgi:hypothetical protein